MGRISILSLIAVFFLTISLGYAQVDSDSDSANISNDVESTVDEGASDMDRAADDVESGVNEGADDVESAADDVERKYDKSTDKADKWKKDKKHDLKKEGNKLERKTESGVDEGERRLDHAGDALEGN